MFDLFNRFLVGFVLKRYQVADMTWLSRTGLDRYFKPCGGPSQFVSDATPSSMEQAWRVKYGMLLEYLKEYRLKMKDEVLEHYNGLPLAMHTLAAAIHNQILGIK